jgi:hypothetical protein
MSETPQFNHDFGRADVEKLARSICEEYGADPDKMIPDSGYSDAVLVPRWWKFQDDAIKFIAMMRASS